MGVTKDNRATAVVATVLPAVGAAGLGLLTHTTSGDAASTVEFLLSGGAALGGFWALEKGLKPAAGACFLACPLLAQAAFTGMFGGIESFYFGLANVFIDGVTYAIFKWKTGKTHNFETGIKANAFQLGQLRVQKAQLDLATRLEGLAPAAPLVLEGTVLERAVSEGFHGQWKTLPQAVRVQATPYGWIASVDLPARLDRGRVMKGWGGVASHLAVEGLIENDKFEVLAGTMPNSVTVNHFARDLLFADLPYESTPGRTFLDPILLGIDMYGNPVELETAYKHTIIAGSSDFGKSNIVKLIALRLAEAGAELYGIDMKDGAPELRQIEDLLSGLATDVEQGRALFTNLRQEMKERGDILAEYGDDKWVPEKHGRKAIYILADELAELVRQGNDKTNEANKGEGKISDPLVALLALARAYAIHIILIAQQPSKAVFGGSTDGRGNVANRICVRMNEKLHNQFVFGDVDKWDASKLLQAGRFLMQSPKHDRAIHCKAQFLTREVREAEVARIAAKNMIEGSTPRLMILPPTAEEATTNQDKVWYLLQKHGAMQRREIDEALGLTSKQTLRALDTLKSRGVYQEEGSGAWRVPQEATSGLRVVRGA